MKFMPFGKFFIFVIWEFFHYYAIGELCHLRRNCNADFLVTHSILSSATAPENIYSDMKKKDFET